MSKRPQSVAEERAVFDDNPEWTEADFARARPASEALGPELAAGLVKRRGRPPLADRDRKEPISIRLSPEVLEFFRGKGPRWQTLIDEVLRGYVMAFGSLPEPPTRFRR